MNSSLEKHMGLVAALIIVAFCTSLGGLVFNNTLTLKSIETKLDAQVTLQLMKDAEEEGNFKINEERFKSIWPRLRKLEHKVGIFSDAPGEDN